MVWHALPEVEEKVLDLEKTRQTVKRGNTAEDSHSRRVKRQGLMWGYLLKVDIDGVVQNALTVCFVHHDQGVDLKWT